MSASTAASLGISKAEYEMNISALKAMSLNSQQEWQNVGSKKKGKTTPRQSNTSNVSQPTTARGSTAPEKESKSAKKRRLRKEKAAAETAEVENPSPSDSTGKPSRATFTSVVSSKAGSSPRTSLNAMRSNDSKKSSGEQFYSCDDDELGSPLEGRTKGGKNSASRPSTKGSNTLVDPNSPRSFWTGEKLDKTLSTPTNAKSASSSHTDTKSKMQFTPGKTPSKGTKKTKGSSNKKSTDGHALGKSDLPSPVMFPREMPKKKVSTMTDLAK